MTKSGSTVARVVFLAMLLFARLATVGAAHDGTDEKPLTVLFIGNSLTGDVPTLVASLAEAAGGRKIHVTSHIKAGATLEDHAGKNGAVEIIRHKAWDVVVLQEQPARAVKSPQRMLEAARTLDTEIDRRGARSVLFLTWARQNRPETQPALNRIYSDAARKLEAEVAPVGPAWSEALQADPNRSLYVSNHIHANATGSYLAACVFYAVLLDKSPVGLPGQLRKGDQTLVDLSLDEARKLQKIAWKMVRDARDKPPKARWAWEEDEKSADKK